MTRTHDTAIVIATCRRLQLLRRTLESLAEAGLPNGLREILVVENGGALGAAEVLQGFAERLPVQHLLQAEGNKCRALNLALDTTSADLIYFMDDDVRVSHDTVTAYTEAAERYGPGHHFSGPLVADWEEEPPDWLKHFLPPSAIGWHHGEEEKYLDEPWFIGSNWAAFRGDVLSVGGFREHIGPGSPTGAIGDEMELQRRLLDAGGRGVYLPSARIWHHVPRSDCDFEWARRRQQLHGRTYGVLGWTPPEGAIPEGARAWAQFAALTAKVAVARALGWSAERRAWLEMTRARTLGYLKGRGVGRRSSLTRNGSDVLIEPRPQP